MRGRYKEAAGSTRTPPQQQQQLARTDHEGISRRQQQVFLQPISTGILNGDRARKKARKPTDTKRHFWRMSDKAGSTGR